MAISKRGGSTRVVVRERDGEIELNINITIDVTGLGVAAGTASQQIINEQLTGTGELVPDELFDFELPTIEFGEDKEESSRQPKAKQQFKFKNEEST